MDQYYSVHRLYDQQLRLNFGAIKAKGEAANASGNVLPVCNAAVVPPEPGKTDLRS